MIELNGSVTLNVDQAGLALTGPGSYGVFDTADAIEGAVTDDSAGVLADATSVTTTDVSPVLTIAEYQQIDGNTTLTVPYRIDDDLQDLSVGEAIVYIGAENYLAPSPVAPTSVSATTPRRCTRPRSTATTRGWRSSTRPAWSPIAGWLTSCRRRRSPRSLDSLTVLASFDVTDLSTGMIGEAGAAGGGIIAASFVATVRATDATPDQAITLVGIDSVDTFAMDAGSYTDLTVEQVRAVEDGKNETAVSYTVLDDASVIEGAISDIDNADEVSSPETLTLTVAEFDALDDDDTDLMTAYDIVDDAAIIAAALVAGEASVNGANSVTTNGGAVSLSFAEADALLNGNGTAPAQTGSVAADVTVTDDISVAQAF